MRPWRVSLKTWTGMFVVVTTSSCAHLASRQVAWDAMVTCRHCNCLMSADADPAAACSVCHCGFQAQQCITHSASTQCQRHR